MICPDYLTPGVETVFRRIQHERMRDVPLLNPVLQVQCVGFRPWQSHCLGVLLTPWFMSLVLLPCDEHERDDLAVGRKVVHAFPSGDYEFIVGEESGIGRYLSCSLFSPMFEFPDQAVAVATAQAVMHGLMDEENREDLSMREQEIARIWRGDTGVDGELPDTGSADGPGLAERLEQTISRRDLLRGRFAATGGPGETGRS